MAIFDSETVSSGDSSRRFLDDHWRSIVKKVSDEVIDKYMKSPYGL